MYNRRVFEFEPEWRNWYTQGTQNPPGLTAREGSNPSSGTTPIGQGCKPLVIFREISNSLGSRASQAYLRPRGLPAGFGENPFLL